MEVHAIQVFVCYIDLLYNKIIRQIQYKTKKERREGQDGLPPHWPGEFSMSESAAGNCQAEPLKSF